MHPLFIFSLLNDFFRVLVVGGLNAEVAGSLFSRETMTPDKARLVISVFLLGVLVTLLLVAGLFLISFGLLSKRPEDRTGRRDPSDLGLLKNEAWPEVPYQEHILPAEDEDQKSAQLVNQKDKDSVPLQSFQKRGMAK